MWDCGYVTDAGSAFRMAGKRAECVRANRLAPMPGPYAIVIGASAGGVGALLEFVQSLPGPLDAVVGIVLRAGSRHSILPELLNARGANNAPQSRDGAPLDAGRVYVAPTDYH